MTAVQTLAFTIPGHICSDHRRVVARFGRDRFGHKVPLKFPHSYIKPEYTAFKNKVAIYAHSEAIQNGWVMPPKKTKITMRVHFVIATKMMSKAGKTAPHLVHRPMPDEDNCIKCIKDALQGVLYHNDREVAAYPLAKEWITRAPGTNEWIEVELTVMEDLPGTQLELKTKGGKLCTGLTKSAEETFKDQGCLTAPVLSVVALSSSGAVIPKRSLWS